MTDNTEINSPLWKVLPASAAMCALIIFAFSASIIPAALMRAAHDFAIRPELLATVIAVQIVELSAVNSV